MVVLAEVVTESTIIALPESDALKVEALMMVAVWFPVPQVVQ